jgi:hypothetical protein
MSWLPDFLRKKKVKQQVAAVVEKAPDESKPSRKLCLELLDRLEPTRFKRYRPFTGAVTTFDALYHNIDLYTLKLRYFADHIEGGKHVTPAMVEITTMNVTVEKFFLTSANHYQDPVVAVRNLTEQARRLCVLMAPSDTASYGPFEHNLRMLRQLFVNLRVLLVTLIEVSLAE